MAKSSAIFKVDYLGSLLSKKVEIFDRGAKI